MRLLKNREERAVIRTLWRAHWLLTRLHGKEIPIMGQKTDMATAAAAVEADIAALQAADVVDATTAAAGIKALQDADAQLKALTPPAVPPAT
jgi:hypothetical protein